MPVNHTIDIEARLVRIVGSGVVTDDEMVRCVADLRADPALEPNMNTLSDMRDIDVAFTSEGVSRLVTVMRNSADRRVAARAAIVVNSEVAFGMGRMFELRAEQADELSIRIFRDMAEALEWLDQA